MRIFSFIFFVAGALVLACGGNECPGSSPAGCKETGCQAGYVCNTDPQQVGCFATGCACSDGRWVCTADCLGGKCVPQ